MKFVPIVQLETPRLRLRRFCLTDLEAYHRHITSDPEIAKTMLWEANPDIAHAEGVLKKILSRYGTPEGCRWAIALKEDDSLIGTVSLLHFEETDNSCSFAYMLGRAFWGNGYGTEALKAVFAFAFSEMEVSFIAADHFASNPASGKAMQKAGMRIKGILPGKYEKNGTVMDAVEYRITKEDWLKPSGH